MTYHTLKVYKYMHHLDKKQLDKVYQNKLASNQTVVTNLHYFIDGYSLPLFYTKIPTLNQLQEVIDCNSTIIKNLISKLPQGKQNQLYLGNLAKEIQMTNKIEGLNISMPDIQLAIQGAIHHKMTNQYQPFAAMYLLTNTNKHLKINHLFDIRKIYNHLFQTIFKNNIIPTKTMFRNTPIRIGSDYQTVYQPKAYEKEFIPNLKEWIKFINSKQYQPLIKAVIAHFFFECIHPFNDGNGRTGRYILCTYLASKLDKYTATSFAQEIAYNSRSYYKAFQQLDNPLLYGDMTLFIISIFKIIIKSQQHIQKVAKNI